MFWQTCGSRSAENANFCRKCGASISNGQPSTSDGKHPQSFREYMENRVRLQNQGAELTTIQKKKSHEHILENSRKKSKKDEIVKVLAMIFTNLLRKCRDWKPSSSTLNLFLKAFKAFNSSEYLSIGCIKKLTVAVYSLNKLSSIFREAAD
jgi:hypothetical protein